MFKNCCMLLLLLAHVRARATSEDEEYPPPFIRKISEHFHDICIEKTGVSNEAIREFSEGEIHEDEKLKCYMNCLFNEYDVVDETGDVHMEKLFISVPGNLRNIMTKMFEKCRHPVGETPCDKAWWFHQCWKKEDPVHYFLI